MEKNMLPNNMQIEDLPAEIRVRIFMHLNYRERIRLESVSRTWRTMALDTWKGQRILRFSREMLHLNKPWKDNKQINSIIENLNRQQNEVTTKLVHGESNECSSVKATIEVCTSSYEQGLRAAQLKAMRDYRLLLTNPALYKQEKTSKQLAPLKAILHRCAPFLDELHLLGDFDIQMRFGCIFSQLSHPFGRLAHLHIAVPLDAWHLHKIQCHLAPQLISLAVFPIENKNNKAYVAFRELLANCNKLENLQIVDIHFGRLFAGHSENNGGRSQPSSSVAKIESKCSFMPSTLKFLLILDNADAEDYENPDHLVNILLSLLANCPQLRFMHIFVNTEFDIFKLFEERNPRELDKIIRLQFPFFIADFDYSFQYIQRPEFRNLKALNMVNSVEAANILQVAKCCPNLEHLGISLLYEARWDMQLQNYVVNISNLVALHQFKRLSSMEISMEFAHFHDFHMMFCPGGERADNIFLKILTELDQINPLRSLDLKVEDEYGNPNPGLSQDYLIKMITKLKHLETFSCGFYLQIDIDDMTGISHFCAKLEEIFLLEEIFNSQQGANKKSLKFVLLAKPNKWVYDEDERERKNLLVEWQKGSGTRRSKMNWHCRPCYFHSEPERSIVLHELFTSQFGQRTSSMLFDSFDTIDEEEH